MNKYCWKCGHPLLDGAKFCVRCGQPVNARNEKQNIATESKNEPAKENANATTPKGNAKHKEGGFFTKLIEEVKNLILFDYHLQILFLVGYIQYLLTDLFLFHQYIFQ